MAFANARAEVGGRLDSAGVWIEHHRRVTKIGIASSLVLILLVGISMMVTPWWKQVTRNTYIAYFPNTNGVYTGDEIRILGVAVGTIEKIEPQPQAAKVTFTVDSEYPVPADVRAAILSPSLVTSRAIQLVPVYSGGPKLADGATIPEERTAVPVEWDDLRKQLEKLTESLQPTTEGGTSALGQFVNTSAANLRGEGDTARDTIIKLSQAVSALGDHSTDIFSTLRNLETFVSALTSSSELLASFNKNLANITTVMTNTPNEWGQAIAGLDGAVNDLRPFVAENREAIGTTFDHLNSITTALNDSRRDIKQTLHVAPNVFQNFLNIYQPAQSAVTGILALSNFADTVQSICGSIESAGRIGAKNSARLCEQYLSPIIKNRQYNFLPLGFNPFVGASARPNEITYSEDKLNPHIPPPGAPGGQPPADSPGPGPLPQSPQALPGGALPPAPLAVHSTDPHGGLPGLMVPAAAPVPPRGTP
jgi:phospholipid/cholesterol/gamma-HCH transport system substrate-binding protein